MFSSSASSCRSLFLFLFCFCFRFLGSLFLFLFFFWWWNPVLEIVTLERDSECKRNECRSDVGNWSRGSKSVGQERGACCSCGQECRESAESDVSYSRGNSECASGIHSPEFGVLEVSPCLCSGIPFPRPPSQHSCVSRCAPETATFRLHGGWGWGFELSKVFFLLC